jgi:uncharacterized protein
MHVLKTFLMLVALCVFTAGAYAAEADADPSLAHRLELAKRMHEIKPVKDQVDKAIEIYVERLPEKEREVYRTALKQIMNYEVLEKVSVDAYVQTYTEAELEAMVAFFGSPEGRSASEKFDAYGKIVYPEIVKMLDQAIMKAKTGTPAP